MLTSKKQKVFMGIDPGLATTGYGIIQEQGNNFRLVAGGIITTPAREEFGKRLATIHKQLNSIIKRYQPNSIAIEELFFAKNVTSALKVSQARGVAILAARQNGYTIKEFTPLQIKQAITGYGRASKSQMQKMTKLILHLKITPRPDDLADAIAIAICGAQTKEFK